MVIEHSGMVADKLVSGKSEAFGSVDNHEMVRSPPSYLHHNPGICVLGMALGRPGNPPRDKARKAHPVRGEPPHRAHPPEH